MQAMATARKSAKRMAAAAAVLTPAVAGGVVGGADVAGADAAACANAPGIAVMNQDCIDVRGSGRRVNSAEMRAWRFSGYPQNICQSNSRVMGVIHNNGGATTTWTGSYRSGCIYAFPTWMNHSINRDFANKTWVKGEWKENDVWSGRHPMVCIELNPWDFC